MDFESIAMCATPCLGLLGLVCYMGVRGKLDHSTWLQIGLCTSPALPLFFSVFCLYYNESTNTKFSVLAYSSTVVFCEIVMICLCFIRRSPEAETAWWDRLAASNAYRALHEAARTHWRSDAHAYQRCEP